MLDVAIGMVFIYLLISVICTATNEIIEAYLKLRSVDLEEGIRQLLSDPEGKGLTKDIYDHPLVNGLFRGTYDSSKIRESNKRYTRGSDLPSYIPAKNFALALIDVLPLSGLNTGGEKSPEALANDMLQKPVISPLNVTPQPLRTVINAIDNEQVKKALLTILDAARDDVTKVREGIEDWYNSSMDRVSGWYKRRVQKIVFLLGLGIVLCMNADSIAIFNNLVNDRPLRSAIVNAAQHMGIDTTKNAGIITPTSKIKADADSLYVLGLPIGWRWKSYLNNTKNAVSNFNAIPGFDYENALGSSLWQWFLKLMGWLITTFAISLGAPFWFDMLNKVMTVRSTIKPKEKVSD